MAEEQSESVTMQLHLCGYADLFVSKALGSKLLRVSLNGTVAVALLSLTKLDRFLARKAREVFVYLNSVLCSKGRLHAANEANDGNIFERQAA